MQKCDNIYSARGGQNKLYDTLMMILVALTIVAIVSASSSLGDYSNSSFDSLVRATLSNLIMQVNTATSHEDVLKSTKQIRIITGRTSSSIEILISSGFLPRLVELLSGKVGGEAVQEITEGLVIAAAIKRRDHREVMQSNLRRHMIIADIQCEAALLLANISTIQKYCPMISKVGAVPVLLNFAFEVNRIPGNNWRRHKSGLHLVNRAAYISLYPLPLNTMLVQRCMVILGNLAIKSSSLRDMMYRGGMIEHLVEEMHLAAKLALYKPLNSSEYESEETSSPLTYLRTAVWFMGVLCKHKQPTLRSIQLIIPVVSQLLIFPDCLVVTCAAKCIQHIALVLLLNSKSIPHSGAIHAMIVGTVIKRHRAEPISIHQGLVNIFQQDIRNDDEELAAAAALHAIRALLSNDQHTYCLLKSLSH